VPRLRNIFRDIDKSDPHTRAWLALQEAAASRAVTALFRLPDCVIRTGELMDSTLVARRLGQLSWIICAAPRYFKEHGEPDSVTALHAHRIVN
jgi:DNA-binding transcriptional LysR family regulator